MDLKEVTLSNEPLFQGKVIRVERQTVQLPDKSVSTREIVRHTGGACIVAIDEHHCIYLIRQYRKALDCELLELPAGKLEAGEDPCDCAARELKEETGFTADHLESLGSIYPTPGYCDESIFIYLATGLEAGPQDLDPGEFLSVIRLPFKEAYAAAIEGRIQDAKTVAGIFKALPFLDVELN